MKASIILPPEQRGATARMFQFFRLLRRRIRYNRNCPKELPTHQRLRLHFTYLQLYWAKIVEFQMAVGLEAAYFCPREQFEVIALVTRKAQRDLRQSVLPFGESNDRWQEYLTLLDSLSYDINPYEFAERCSKCLQLLEAINSPHSVQTPPIGMDTTHFFRLAGASPGPKLKLADVH